MDTLTVAQFISSILTGTFSPPYFKSVLLRLHLEIIRWITSQITDTICLQVFLKLYKDRTPYKPVLVSLPIAFFFYKGRQPALTGVPLL
jgi:hypothetical protein